MPMSRQTLPATMPLSPVMILTAMPRPASSATAAPASGFGRSTNVRKPSSCRSRSSAGVGAVKPGRRPRCHGDHAGAVAEEPLEHGSGLRRDVGAAREHGLGCALGDEERRPSPSGRRRTRADARGRTAGGQDARMRPSRPARPAGMQLPAPRRARDRGHCRRRARPRSSSSRCRASRQRACSRWPRPRRSSDSWNVIAPSVSVPVLSVNSTSMLPRSSIVTSRFTSTRLRASRREPLERLTETIAGSSCGVMPIAIASENSSASISGRESATLMTKIDTQRRPRPSRAGSRSRAGRPGTPSRPDVRRVPRRSAPKAVAVAGRDDDAASRALVHDRAHEGARRQVDSGESPAEAAVVFSTGSDSPVSTASSHSSCVTSSSRRSAGTMSPTRSATTSPGTSSVTSSEIWAPSRQTSAV